MDDCGYVDGVEIYSSETGLWNYMESEWDPDTTIYDHTRTFFNGMLHFVQEGIAILSMWKGRYGGTFNFPELEEVEDVFAWMACFIGRSQGKLCYLSAYDTAPSNLSIWVLEDYSKDEWTLKHKLTTDQLSEKMNCKCKTDHVVAVHPECNLIYYIAGGDTLMSY
uniref:F-box protein At3g26010-like beta-propeller domain-containing protein n=1 Tax=Oryza punctata TaxID=4537 RepID=A0A0E0KZ50_ORYPU